MITESEKTSIDILKDQSKKITDKIDKINNLERWIQNLNNIKKLGVNNISVEITSRSGFNQRAIESTYRNFSAAIDSKILDILIDYYSDLQHQKIQELSGFQIVNFGDLQNG